MVHQFLVSGFNLEAIFNFNFNFNFNLKLYNIEVEVEDGLQIKIGDQKSMYHRGGCMPKVVLDFRLGTIYMVNLREPLPRRPQLICPRGLSCCSTPHCSCPATPPRAKQSPGSCRRPRPVPLHQEPGSERRSSRTRGAQLASDGPHLQQPTRAVVLLHAPLLVPSDAAARWKKPREQPQAAP